ncbi:MAG: MATE family efflux transporter [Oscillospiraceae bacterium]
MSNALSKKFNVISLMKFTAPTIIMMLFMSLYTMIDGVFVSRFVGTGALSAVNIVYPVLNVVVAIAIMLATGASAVVAKKMGEGKIAEARDNFTLITVIGAVVGVIFGVISIIFIHPMLKMLGASDAIYEYCYQYSFILSVFTPMAILQMLFQYFFVTAGKPMLGLAATIAGGCANMVLDYIFIVPLNMGIAGAALATGIGFSIPAVCGLFYFAVHRKGTMYFVMPHFDKKAIFDSCTNGSSEMVTNLSMAITTFLFNIIMMKYLGEDGVAAITVVLYSQFLLTAVYLGYSSGVAPILSYNYGSGNTAQLKKLFKMSIIFLAVSSVVLFAAALLLSGHIVGIFSKPDTNVFAIAKNGFGLFSISYLFIGFNIFSSGMFTALSNGKVSAIISFLRTFAFLVVSILLLPQIMGINGIWLAVPLAEILALFVSVVYMVKLRKVYGYA